jgi:hypothetical protein
MSAGKRRKTDMYRSFDALSEGREYGRHMSADLERKLAELNEEIRNYPGPIARCDQQLLALLDERARLMAELRTNEERE